MLSAMTPIHQQYRDIKRRYPEAIVFFRLGDFYETFEEDARVTARELEITLTGRDMGKGVRVPMAGVPYHAVENYLARLIAKGYRVAIVEQLSDPKTTKGIVDRDVVRVVTPGTVVEPGMLQAKANNFLVALIFEGPAVGLAFADITTGEFAASQIRQEQLQSELDRLAPAELLLPRTARFTPVGRVIPQTPFDDWRFDLDTARRALLDHFQVATLDGFGCAELPLAARAAGAAIQYLKETQKGILPQVARLVTYSIEATMVLDAHTRRNLEILQSSRTGSTHGSLLSVLDLTRTPMGGRLLRRWLSQPLLDLAELERRQAGIAELHADNLRRAEVVEALGPVADVERLVNRASAGLATPRELLALRRTLLALPALHDYLTGGRWRRDEPETDSPIAELAAAIDPCPEVADLIGRAIVDDPPAGLAEGGVIRPAFSAELDQLKEAAGSARRFIAGLERTERERTGIRSLKVGYNKVFGYYIEVTNPNLDAPLANGSRGRETLFSAGSAEGPSGCGCRTWRDHLERCLGYVRKQTLVGAERFITGELKEYESLILHAQERIVDLETELYRGVCTEIAGAAPRLLRTAQAVARVDVVVALAEVAARHAYVRPRLTNGETIRIVGGRHPVVERSLRETRFIPNDVELANDGCQIVVLTGPNMGGKSTLLRQVGLIVLLAQIGSFVPAAEAEIGLVDRIFTRIGAQDDLAAGQSTFLVEMSETALTLSASTSRSLVILDEVGRGTSTYDGLAVARAVVEYLHENPRARPKTLFATHFHELADLEASLPRVRNYRTDVLEEGRQVVFLYRIVSGAADRSYGIHCARLAGLPREVVARAEEILRELEQKSAGRPASSGQPLQMSFLPAAVEVDPLAAALAALDIDALSPREALLKLYELRDRARAAIT
ncbi:MAG: DNA mismatch repair protein MutS [Chloroflexi bacterium]|nr:DNA mismatch repair protein MutS [Chloroflexota bacterium]